MKQIILLLTLITICSCSSDIENRSSQSITFSDVYSIQADSLEVDLIGSDSENAIYMTYSGDNGYNENLLKFDLNLQVSTEVIHPDITANRQLEIVNNLLYSASKNDIYRFDLDLGNETLISDVGFDSDIVRTTTYNNNIWSIYGIGYQTTYNVLPNDFSWTWGASNDVWAKGDFEIINDNAYCFGGVYYPSTVSNKIKIYDMIADSWTEQTMPFNVYESFTALYNNMIIVAGNKNLDSSDPFLYTFNPATNSFSALATTFDFTGKTIRSITVVNQELYIAYADLISPLPNLITIKIVKASLP